MRRRRWRLWPGRGRPWSVVLLRCSLRQHQWSGAEEHGNCETREHDNLFNTNLPLFRSNEQEFH
jgi:hypothetical protein